MRYSIAVLLTLFSLCFVACTGDAESTSAKTPATVNKQNKNKDTSKPKTPKQSITSTMQEFVSDKFKFSIKQPNNWEVMRDQMSNVPVIFANRQKGTIVPGVETISVAVELKPMNDLQTYLDYSKEQLKQSGQLGVFLEESDGVNAHKFPFKRLVFSRLNNGIPQGKAISFLYIKGQNGYVVTCMASQGKFDRMRNLFEEIAQSFKINL